MDYIESINGCRNLDELFLLWKNKPKGIVTAKKGELTIDHSNSYFIADGIVNPNIWEDTSHKKILYVLKEAYGEDWGENTLASWLGNSHPRVGLWSRVARWTYGLQRTSLNSIRRYKESLTEEEHNEALEAIAVLNLKKSNGKSCSDYDEIAAYAKFDKEEIQKEFELIDADIVVCGSTFKTLWYSVFEKPPLQNDRNDNWYYFREICGRQRLFIDYYHPANQWPDLLNYYGLIGIYQQALLEQHGQQE